MNNKQFINKLNEEKSLSFEEWTHLLSSYDNQDFDYASELAQKISVERFGKKIYFRGIIEFTNYCKNDCYYCGIRHSNKNAQRYRLTKDDILSCCDIGYEYGFRTFVLQGGEDTYYKDEILCDIISDIKKKYPDCAVTLSVGELSRNSYEKLFNAGADRYLLRHEAADKDLYEKIHPAYQKFENRMRCLKDLKEIGYQVGCGFMVGVKYQSIENLAKDMLFIGEFSPAMVGIGPFISHKDTPFGTEPCGDVSLTLFLMSLTRIMLPDVLLPATTALGTADADGRKLGVLCGCNVVMPNISPSDVRKKYMLYDNKVGTDLTAELGINMLKEQMSQIGYEIVCDRGDHKDYIKGEVND